MRQSNRKGWRSSFSMRGLSRAPDPCSTARDAPVRGDRDPISARRAGPDPRGRGPRLAGADRGPRCGRNFPPRGVVSEPLRVGASTDLTVVRRRRVGTSGRQGDGPHSAPPRVRASTDLHYSSGLGGEDAGSAASAYSIADVMIVQ